MPYSSFSTKELADIYEGHPNDFDLISELNETLKHRRDDDDFAIDLQVRVAMTLRAARRQGWSPKPREVGASAPPARATRTGRTPVRDWLGPLLERNGLQRPDGRPLFRYRMTTAEYGQARGVLVELASSGRLEDPDDRSASLFVAYCAEWFRREAETTFRKWESLAPAIFPRLSQSAKAELTDRGMRFWRRSIRLDSRGRQFLLTLALEGGFSAKLLRQGARGWLKEYLTALIRLGLAEPSPTIENVAHIAHSQRGLLPESYQDSDFVSLCAELTLVLVELRQKVDREAPRGVDPIAYLDASQPEWRDLVPIYFPEGDEDELAKSLLNGLMREVPSRLFLGDVSAVRLLERVGDEWSPALLLTANGGMDRLTLSAFDPHRGRVLVGLAGAMGDRLPEAFASIDPPANPEENWRVRPIRQLDRPIRNFPFGEAALVRLTQSGGAGKLLVWRGGEPVRSELLVFVSTELEDRPDPKVLRLIGRGSVRAPQKTVFALAPSNWVARTEAGGTLIESLGRAGLGRTLYTVAEPIRFSDPVDHDMFLVEPGRDPEQWRVEVVAQTVGDVAIPDDRIQLCKAPVAITLKEGSGRGRPARDGELLWRQPGGAWRPLTLPLSQEGLVEITWRDSATGIQRDKVRLAVLPATASVVGRRKSLQSASILLAGLSGWSRHPVGDEDQTFEVGADEVTITYGAAPKYEQRLRLTPPSGASFTICVSLPGHGPIAVLADGTVAGKRVTLSAAEMRRVLLVSPDPSWLHLELRREGDRRPTGADVAVEGTVSVGSLSGLIEELFALSDSQDAVIELTFNGNFDQVLRLTRAGLQPLVRDRRTVYSPASPGDAVAVLRSLLRPADEQVLPMSSERGRWELPEVVESPSLAYLRDDRTVINRPTVVPATTFVGGIEPGSLISAMFVADYAERQSMLRSTLASMGAWQHTSENDLGWLLKTASALRGLPANSIDALKALPTSPSALIRLLLFASAVDPVPVWQLQRELPFLWLALPASAWSTSIKHHFEELAVALQAALPQADAPALAMRTLRAAAEQVIGLEPGLRAIFAHAGLPLPGRPVPLSSLRALVMGHIQRFGDVEGHAGEAERMAEALVEAGLSIPEELRQFSWQTFPTLLVPIALAQSTLGKFHLTLDAQWQARRALRLDPDFVWSAYQVILEQALGTTI